MVDLVLPRRLIKTVESRCHKDDIDCVVALEGIGNLSESVIVRASLHYRLVDIALRINRLARVRVLTGADNVRAHGFAWELRWNSIGQKGGSRTIACRRGRGCRFA